jgi:coproporphyrinogen III oxidase-like Fe-S oxidoreductase
MIPAGFIWKPIVQKAVTGRASRFRLTSQLPQWPRRLSSPGLYLHIPFCKNLCPYCPYNRVEYEEDLFAAYEQAVKQEIDLYAPHLKNCEFVSFYIGGGTPTVNWRGLLRIMRHLFTSLSVHCDVCIELHPANMDNDCLESLRDAGVTMLSVGVESTSDDILKQIGRNHDAKTAIKAVQRALSLGFKSINVDLMFALPGQTLDDWKADVETIIDLGVDQLSTYPLFSFPYSDLGKTKSIKRVSRPSHSTVKSMLDFTNEHCEQRGLPRCAVWSWLRRQGSKFSSITRHHYVGFGPSAASMTGTEFYVNTFDVEAYAQSLPHKRPIALSMPVSRRVEMAYWLYWRIYELKVENSEFQNLFGEHVSLDAQFGHLIKPFHVAGMMKKVHGGYQVTKPGAYWIHRLQNEYSLSYINHLWGTCRKEPWPKKVKL